MNGPVSRNPTCGRSARERIGRAPCRHRRALARWLAGTCIALFAAASLQAGSFTANPVRLTLPPGATSTSLLLENKGDQTVVVQATAVAWAQEGGRDVFTETTDLVVSPPIFKVAPGATQTVRVGSLRAADPIRERQYRLFLQEVPPPPEPGQPGVAVALQLALPVFVEPLSDVRAAPRLAWRARPSHGASIELTLSNEGTGHVQLIDGALVAADGSVLAEFAPRAYVLPGQTFSWTLPAARAWTGELLKLRARTHGGELTVPLPDR